MSETRCRICGCDLNTGGLCPQAYLHKPVASPQATRPEQVLLDELGKLEHRQLRDEHGREIKGALWVKLHDVAGMIGRWGQPAAGTTPHSYIDCTVDDCEQCRPINRALDELQGTAPQAERPEQIAIHIFQHDWIPGFAAFHDDGRISETAKAHVVLNLGSFMSAIQTKELDPKDLPYFVAESLMHEVIHVLEAWANVEFSEDRVEALLTKYREKYERATIWEYTGGEPHE